MALVPHLLNVVLNIGKGCHRILFSVSYSRSQGAQAGLKHAAGRAGEDPSPDWTEAGAPSSGLTPALPRGLSVTQPHGAVWPPIPGSPWPLLSQSLDLPSFTLRYLALDVSLEQPEWSTSVNLFFLRLFFKFLIVVKHI